MAATGALDAALEPLLGAPARSAVLLDVDGTLAPIVRHADDAHVPEPTRAPLIAIARGYGFVACVSGRRAAEARRIVSLGTITYVGNHGAEVLRGGATDVELEPSLAEWGARVHEFADGQQDDRELRRLRVRTEDKALIVAFHWRGSPDEDAAEEAVRGIAARAEDAGLATHWGRKVLEVRPPVALDKGRGVERLLEAVDVDNALYAGDDRTDLDAFAALRRMTADGRLRHAACIGVESDETPAELAAEADVLVDGTRGVRDLLLRLAGAGR